MRLYERKILHFESDTSDKVYILELIDNETSPETFSLITSWGRRSAPRLSSQVRHFNAIYSVVHEEYLKTTRAKKRAGYRQVNLDDLAIPGYNAAASTCLPSSVNTRSEPPSALPSEASLSRGII